MELRASRNCSPTKSSTNLDETRTEHENHQSPRQLKESIFGGTLASTLITKPMESQSPMTQLADSIRDFQWFNQTPRRRLSLESNTPSMARPQQKTCDQGKGTTGEALSNSPDVVEVDDSPFLQERCSMRGSSSFVVRVGHPSTMPVPIFSLEHSSTLTPLESHSMQSSDQVKKVPLRQEVLSSRNPKTFSDETNHKRHFLPSYKCFTAIKERKNKTNWKPVCESKDSKSYTFPLEPTVNPQKKDYSWKPARVLRLTGNTLGLHHLLSSPILEMDEVSISGQQKGLHRRRLLATQDQENINPNEFLDNLMDYQRVGPNSCKRILRNHDDSHPVKKRRSNADHDLCQQKTPLQAKAAHSLPMQTEESKTLVAEKTVTPRFMRCHSETEVIIKSALSRADTHLDLIGDFSRPYTLPLVQSKHNDLKAISSNTLASLLNGEYGDDVCNYVIVDCRYPYEFDGGHIRGSVNVYTKDEIISTFLTPQEYQCSTPFQKKTVLIFHCEFSSERGPRLMHFLRNKDREMHRETYPALFYPEMYLLEGGYKAFFESHQMLCEPSCYKPMIHSDHVADLKHFRSKSKSWTAAGSDRTHAGIRISRQLSERQSSTARLVCRKLP